MLTVAIELKMKSNKLSVSIMRASHVGTEVETTLEMSCKSFIWVPQTMDNIQHNTGEVKRPLSRIFRE
jgi:hypothetical protein